MDKDWKRLGEAIRSSRQGQGMTQEELAEAAGVGRSSVQNFEMGRPFTRTPPSLRAITKALGWSYDRAASIVEGRPEVDDAAPQAAAGGVPEDELTEVVTSAMVAVVDTMTASEIRDVSRRVAEELKRRASVRGVPVRWRT